jgi:hexokinase
MGKNEGFKFIQKHGMDYRNIRIGALLNTYLEEMQQGLDGREGSLLMLPSYVNTAGNLQKGQPIVVVDAGGTNLRIALIMFDSAGRCTFLSEIRKLNMPGVDDKIEAAEFFEKMADWLLPYMKETGDISISFAYPTEIQPNLDGRIIRMVKEVSITGMEGQLLGKRLEDALSKKGAHSCRVVVINDAVASALAGMAEKPDEGYGSFAGTILGTGHNGCYIESNEKIGKIKGLDPEGTMMINTEAGGYALAPRSDLDEDFDHTTNDPGYHVYEKMVSGAYLGPLCAFFLKKAAEEGVFGPHMKTIRQITSMEADKFLRSGNGKIADYCIRAEDAENAYAIVENTILRSARLCALQMAALAVKTRKKDSNRVCITAEGSTFYKMCGLREEVLKTLHPCLDTFNLSADVLEVENAVLKGCAIAGLLK